MVVICHPSESKVNLICSHALAHFRRRPVVINHNHLCIFPLAVPFFPLPNPGCQNVVTGCMMCAPSRLNPFFLEPERSSLFPLLMLCRRSAKPHKEGHFPLKPAVGPLLRKSVLFVRTQLSLSHVRWQLNAVIYGLIQGGRIRAIVDLLPEVSTG